MIRNDSGGYVRSRIRTTPTTFPNRCCRALEDTQAWTDPQLLQSRSATQAKRGRTACSAPLASLRRRLQAFTTFRCVGVAFAFRSPNSLQATLTSATSLLTPSRRFRLFSIKVLRDYHHAHLSRPKPI